MSRYINVASVHFRIENASESKSERDLVIAQLNNSLDRVEGTGVDLLLTCEGVGSRGQSMEEAESPDEPGEIYTIYREFALRNHATVAGSIKLRKDGNVFNAIIFISPDGKYLGDYCKTFITSGEILKGISPGDGPVVVDTPAGKLGGVICYDLNFDDLRNGYHALRPDILVFSSMFHGDHLPLNWAYQCRSYFVSACKDNSSYIIDPLGKVTSSTNYYGRIVRERINLDRFIMHQDRNMEVFPEIYRKYKNKVKIDYNPALAVAGLYSDTEDLSASEIAAEFGLVSLDELMVESRKKVEAARREL